MGQFIKSTTSRGTYAQRPMKFDNAGVLVDEVLDEFQPVLADYLP